MSSDIEERVFVLDTGVVQNFVFRFFVLQKILSDVTNSSEEKTELFGVANETSDLLEDMAASMASRKGSISTDSIEKVSHILQKVTGG